MPRDRPTVASFWVLRPVEHPNAPDYPAMLRILQTSCDRLGLRHVVLTDPATLANERWPQGIEGWAVDIPQPLMQACTEVQARWLETGAEGDTLFVGADCIFLRNPAKHYPQEPGLCVTYRHPDANYPINTGAQMIRGHSLDKVRAIYRRIADRCGTKWCDDQRAIRAELDPMPELCGTYERAGVKIGFLPMKTFNYLPKTEFDPCKTAVMLHFRGKQHSTGQTRKELLFAWAAKHGFT